MVDIVVRPGTDLMVGHRAIQRMGMDGIRWARNKAVSHIKTALDAASFL